MIKRKREEIKAPSSHSKLPASSCERWWNCPGSVKLTKQFPFEPNKYAAEGTIAHGLASQALIGGWDYEKLLDQEGQERQADGFKFIVTEEMLNHVWTYVETVRDARALHPAARMIVEEKVCLSFDAELFGTCDAAVIIPFQKLFIFDFKYGAGKGVSPYQNKQLMYYALGYYAKTDITEVELVIVQPRYRDGDTGEGYCFPAEELREFGKELQKRARKALKPNAPLNPGDWCSHSFCPARAVCPALKEFSKELVATDFDRPPAAKTLSVRDIKRVLDNAKILVDWVKAVEEYAKDQVLSGVNIPGWKCIEGFGNRKWKDETAVEADFFDSLGEKIYAPRKLKTPAQLEKVLGKKRKSEIEEYVHKPMTGYKLVPQDKPGEPVKMLSAQEDF